MNKYFRGGQCFRNRSSVLERVALPCTSLLNIKELSHYRNN